ncbi:MAG: peptidyl-prolyl cis-trans isomerase [Verrucomicrobia bacterium]|nr:peptidyl-prolyl cis-trans isomerase [Verrucomicrobiota bacterium]MCF7707444.1 peptidyl-prolyl cis-trans isomerase [Verrucomicrobiota bacterium]
MKRALVLFVICVFNLAAWFGANGAPQLVDGIAVIVNDKVITYNDVQRLVGPSLDVLSRQYGNNTELLREKLAEVQRSAIEQLVERELILHEFKEKGYNLPESIIEDEVQRRIRENYGDRSRLIKTLQSKGRTYEDYRKGVREDIIIDSLRRKHISSEIIISPQKIENYYQENKDKFEVGDQVNLRIIVLGRDAGSDDVSRALAEEIVEKARGGSSFQMLASVYSEGSQKSQGGSWGWVERSVLRSDLAEVAFELEPGQVSNVIETPDAFYIMKVEDIMEAHVRPLSEVRDQIEQTLKDTERARLEDQWIERLKEKSFIRYF